MKHLPNENILGLDFSFFKNVSGSEKWHVAYNKPRIGITFYHSNLGNNDVLGYATGASTWIDFPFVNEQHHRFSLNLRLGISNVSKPFNHSLNPSNIAISSNINCLAIGGLQYQYKWNKISLGTRIELTHISNAAFVAPNLGLNIFQTSISMGYVFSKNKFQIEFKNSSNNQSDTTAYNYNYCYITGFVSQKQLFNYLNENFKVSGGTISYQHVFSLPVGVEIGFDIMNNQSDIKLLADKEIYVNRNLKTGAYLGYVVTLDKLHFLIAMGHYLHDPYNLNDKLYHKVGLRYVFFNRFVINTILKSHWGNADYLELGLGMRFG